MLDKTENEMPCHYFQSIQLFPSTFLISNISHITTMMQWSKQTLSYRANQVHSSVHQSLTNWIRSTEWVAQSFVMNKDHCRSSVAACICNESSHSSFRFGIIVTICVVNTISIKYFAWVMHWYFMNPSWSDAMNRFRQNQAIDINTLTFKKSLRNETRFYQIATNSFCTRKKYFSHPASQWYNTIRIFLKLD